MLPKQNHNLHVHRYIQKILNFKQLVYLKAFLNSIFKPNEVRLAGVIELSWFLRQRTIFGESIVEILSIFHWLNDVTLVKALLLSVSLVKYWFRVMYPV